MIKSVFGVLILLILAYGVFFVDLAGKPLSGHVQDVWGSEVVQAKIDLMRDAARNSLEDRLAAVAEQQARQAVRDTLGPKRGPEASRGPGADEISEEDRAALEEIIAQQQ